MGTTPAYLADKLAKHIANLATYTPPTHVYAALMVTGSTDATPGTECSDAGYVGATNNGRMELTLASLFSDNAGELTTIEDILWPACSGSGYTVHAVEFFDAASGGNRCLPFIPISPNVSVPTSEQFKLPTGSATVVFS